MSFLVSYVLLNDFLYIVVNYACVPIPAFFFFFLFILDYVCMSVFYLSVCLCGALNRTQPTHLSVLYLYILFVCNQATALMELFLLVAFHCISSCFNYCFVSYCGK